MKSAVELEAAQVCPFDIQEGTVAFQVLRGTLPKKPGKSADKTGRIAGVLAAAKKDVIANLQKLCAQSQVSCTMMDVDGLALLNCLQACKICPPGEMAVVLNIGSAYTNVAILSDDGLPFVQDVPYAGQEVVAHLCQSTGMDRQAAVAFLHGAEKEKSLSETRQSALKKRLLTPDGTRQRNHALLSRPQIRTSSQSRPRVRRVGAGSAADQGFGQSAGTSGRVVGSTGLAVLHPRGAQG